MRRIVEVIGADVVDYDAEHDCCGSTLYLADEKLGLEAGRRKLESAGVADVLVDARGNCQLLLDRFQGLLTKGGGPGRLAVLTLPQLLGLAMGIEAATRGINRRQLNWLERESRSSTRTVTKIFMVRAAGFMMAGSSPNSAMTAR